jgi:hypothetical protein
MWNYAVYKRFVLILSRNNVILFSGYDGYNKKREEINRCCDTILRRRGFANEDGCQGHRTPAPLDKNGKNRRIVDITAIATSKN